MNHTVHFYRFVRSSRHVWLALGLIALALILTTTRAARATPLYTLVVNSLADTAANDGDCTLREAIIFANTHGASGAMAGECPAGYSGANTIVFSTTGTITLGSSLPPITETLTIFAPPSGITLDGNNAVGIIANSGTTLNLLNMTIANGNVPGGAGGGIYNDGSLNLTKVTLLNNKVTAGPGPKSGGGIYNNGGTVSITASRFESNSAVLTGGGIYNLGGTVNIIDSTFSNNSASDGGGIYQKCCIGSININNSTFSSNSALTGNGGAIANANLYVTNSTFTKNSAFGNGGGIYGSVFIFFNSTFSGNSAGSGGALYSITSDSELLNTIVANSTSGGIVSVRLRMGATILMMA